MAGTANAGAISVDVTAESAQFESSMDRAAAAAERMSQRTQRAQEAAQKKNDAFIASIQRQVDTFGMSSTELLTYEARLKGVSAQADPLIARLQKMKEAADGFDKGAGPQQLTEGVQNLGKASAMTAQQAQQLGYQLNDFFVQVTSGQAPLTALIQQGSQLSGAFGGIRGAIAAVLGLVTPTVVAIGSLAAGVAAVAMAYRSGSQEEKEFRSDLALTGNAAGATRDSVTELAANIGQLPGQAIGPAREALQGLIATGRFSADSLGIVGRAVVNMAQVSKRSVDDVTKDFVRMTDGVTAWAIEQNKQYHYATAAQIEYLRSLEAQGKVQQAVAENAKLLNEALVKAKPELGSLEKLWDNLTKAASRAWDAMKGVGKTDSLGQQLVAAQNRLAEMQERRGNLPVVGGTTIGAKALDAEIAAQRELVENIKARVQLETVAAQASSRIAEDEQRKTLEGSAAYQAALTAIDVAGTNKRLEIAAKSRAEMQIGIERSYESGSLTLEGYMAAEYQIRKAALQDQLTLIQTQAAAAQRVVVSSPVEVKQREAAVLEILNRRYAVEAKLAELEEQRRKSDESLQPPRLVSQNAATPAQQFSAFERSQDGQTQATIKQMEEARGAFVLQLRAQNLAIDAEIDKLDAETQAMGQSTIERQKAVAVARLQAQADKDIAANGSERERILAELADRTERLTGAMQRNYDASRSFETGVTVAFQRYREDAANAAKFAENVIDGSLSRLEDALFQFVTTGKASFGSLFKYMAEEFIRNWIKMQIASSSSGGGWLGSVLNLFSGFAGGTQGTGPNSGADYQNGSDLGFNAGGQSKTSVPAISASGKDSSATMRGLSASKQSAAGSWNITIENHGTDIQTRQEGEGDDRRLRVISRQIVDASRRAVAGDIANGKGPAAQAMRARGQQLDRNLPKRG